MSYLYFFLRACILDFSLPRAVGKASLQGGCNGMLTNAETPLAPWLLKIARSNLMTSASAYLSSAAAVTTIDLPAI